MCELLTCPECSAPASERDGMLACSNCAARFTIDDVAIHLMAESPRSSSFGARAMQSSLIARIYDSAWSPLTFALATRFSLPSRDREAALVHALLGDAPGPWLDLSCGTCGVTRKFPDFGGQRRWIALDSSRAMLERVRAVAPDAVRIRADAARLPFVDSAFGAIVNLAALDLYPDPARVIRESWRVLAPGGRWVASGFVTPPTLLGSRRLRRSWSENAGVHPLSDQRLGQVAAAAGFTRVETRRFGNYLLLSGEKAARC